MKTTRNIWSLLLLGSIAAAGCSDYVEENAPRNQRITTQIALSVPQAPATRMTDVATQADAQFRGIEGLLLMPFSITTTATEPVVGTSQPLAALSDMPTAITDFAYPTSHSNLYDVTLPVSTNAFLIYGRSSAATTGAIVTTPADLSTAATPGAISFALQPIVANTDAWTAEGGKGKAIVDYLNSIFNANWASNSYPALYGLYPMVESMRAGSYASVLAFIQKVYDLLKGSSAAAGVSDVLTAIAAKATVTDGAVTALTVGTDFPGELGLPDGAAVIAWNTSDKKFEAVTTKNNFNGLAVDVANFVKPAALWYRSNSKINTDTASKKSAYENAANKWAAVLAAYTNKPGTVMPNTKSVAVVNPLQYAVARLALRLETAAGTATDRIKDLSGKTIGVDSLELTGVVIGGQSPVDFNFASKYAAETDPLYTIYDNTIVADAKVVNPTADKYTSTLTLETAKNQKVNVAVELKNNSKQNIVTAIPGETPDGNLTQIIPPGCKFYLVGSLDPANPTTASATADGKVLAQDHVTQVTFTVSNLEQAYYVIPNLNSVSVELQLQPIKWKMSTPAEAVLNGKVASTSGDDTNP